MYSENHTQGDESVRGRFFLVEKLGVLAPIEGVCNFPTYTKSVFNRLILQLLILTSEFSY